MDSKLVMVDEEGLNRNILWKTTVDSILLIGQVQLHIS